MKTYRAAVIGCSRMGGFIDNEIEGHPSFKTPLSHGSAYFTHERTELVACADLRIDVMKAFGDRYSVPESSQYCDYREMIDKEQLDIVSVATQPEPRTTIVLYAVEQGVPAIFAEKAMAASLEQADQMVAAVEKHRVAFNLGTNRRWHSGYEMVKGLIDSGELGKLQAFIACDGGGLFNMGSHTFDLLNYLNNDTPAAWVQGHLTNAGDDLVVDGKLTIDPRGQGIVQYENGVTAYIMSGMPTYDFQIIAEKATVYAYDSSNQWEMRVEDPGNTMRWRRRITKPTPQFDRRSSALALVDDLVNALDTRSPTRGGVHAARQSLELSFGMIESHLQDGKRVTLPLAHRRLELARSHEPRMPKLNSA